MRIQHNIAALNAYRNLTNNNSAVSKNLEKLSSGYKINRAGDDAAGLAISEKMRAQITGLEKAQDNANDGISLVQTAEGALTEVHSMLNRMYELAEQSANGTYSDDVDREQLQKEIQSLTDEIDRIADSTNFNGINLLDGSMTKVEKGTVTTVDGVDRMISDVITSSDKTYAAAGNKTILDGGAVSSAEKTSFTLDLSGLSAKVEGYAGSGTATSLDIKINIGENDYTLNFEGKEGSDSTTVGETKEIAASDIANALYMSLTGSTDGVSAGSENEVEIDGIAYNFEKTANGIKFTMVDDPTSLEETAANHDISVDGGDNKDGTIIGSNTVGTTVSAGAIESVANRANTVFTIEASDIVDGAKIKLGDTTVTLAVGADSAYYDADEKTVVDLRLYEEGDSDMDMNVVLSRISKAFEGSVTDQNATDANGEAVSGVTFSVGVSKNDNGEAIGLTVQRTDTGETNVYTTKEKLGAIFSISTTAKETTGGLTLQIGDTSADYNQLSVSVEDCHATSIGVGDVDISTQSGAAAALDKIKDAINYVSDVRGTLGAVQNRLEHTINNLSVTTENITAAESRIRDVDMAEEMMAYTKNNILVQASQAMLAQANQIPQGVLQLLQ